MATITSADNPGFTEAPAWTKDLIIYEINPYAFTSPDGAGDGSGSGTFTGLKDKMAYLQDLGITGIWLAGFSKATAHFYNIKSVYACVRPDELDPALGTARDFKEMIAEAHRRGIRVFLDVITHGVVNDSPLIAEHPDWFKGGTWGMTDYDYDNAEFRAWWVDVWTDYVTEYGVDGYRLDVPRHHQMPLWDIITARCAAAGHPIVVFPERVTTYHFGQRDYRGFSSDMAGEFSPTPQYVGVQISCHDGGWQSGPGNYYQVKGYRANLAYTVFGYNIPIFMSGEEFNAEQVSLPNLEKNLYGGGGPGGWLYGSWIQWEQLEQKPQREMLNDFKKTLRIRQENRDVLHSDRSATHIARVPHAPSSRPIPYARFLPGEKAIVVVGNHEDTGPLTFTLNIPLAEMGLSGKGPYRVTDLWYNTISTATEAELRRYQMTVPANRTPGGGVGVFKIEPISP
ncbi:MAG: alpha-amylase family glycosyl hydrolase [Anaerolineae bacterium]